MFWNLKAMLQLTGFGCSPRNGGLFRTVARSLMFFHITWEMCVARRQAAAQPWPLGQSAFAGGICEEISYIDSIIW